MPQDICHEFRQRGKGPRADDVGVQRRDAFDPGVQNRHLVETKFAADLPQEHSLARIAFHKREPCAVVKPQNGDDEAGQPAAAAQIGPMRYGRWSKFGNLPGIVEMTALQVGKIARRDEVDPLVPMRKNISVQTQPVGCFT